ncbi:hypothetical protein Tsubulata_012461 [Turnera subulata]|uniref:TFIIS N-terminal domain-containing protein n=1 Tax=Turnera subulata TaxID=218843 RepID=A0A9Q0J587_9ROSI|nr:hypothetical protein Tsubulata_012461 [Turnera subulata]
MEALKENLEEVEIGSSAESFRKFLESQKELFHSQIDQLQRLVVTQCNLTGANPLSQEMIREFFASQRTRVRKLVRLSTERASKFTSCGESQDREPKTSDSLMSVDLLPLNSVNSSLGPSVSNCHDPPALNSVGPIPPDPNLLNGFVPSPVSLASACPNPAPSDFVGPNSVPLNSVGSIPFPINSVGASMVEEGPSCSKLDEALPGLDDLDKNFVQDIFRLMQKEETFSGQVKLMERILRIQNPSVLNWFLTKGGAMILATWLTEAAVEEQTSVLLLALKVLCHLPIHKALPEHMSAILHSVNRLRSDISNRARTLLARWSKTFARSQTMKKHSGVNSSTNGQDMILKQSIDEIMGKELWLDNIGNPTSQPLKLLTASADDARRHTLGASQSRILRIASLVTDTRERRKVQLVEQPGQRAAGRSPQASKAASVSQARPMSADDIQKAKLRAQYMQSKYLKAGSSSNGSNSVKNEGLNKLSSTNSSSGSRSPVRPKIEDMKPVILPPKLTVEKILETKLKDDPTVPFGDFCCRVQIQWQTPPEMKLNSLWRLGMGENSKEVDVQRNRNRREIETIYRTFQEIPSNPKGPWDIEMDYDDSLTPEIPIEQQPDADGGETQVTNNEHVNTAAPSTPSLPQITGANGSEPDLELLAVLLKNPSLVFALTSGQAGNLTSEETVKLLDLIKTGGAVVGENLSGKAEGKVEVSLPSPTPSSNPGTSGWSQEVAKNPFSQQRPTGNRVHPEAGLAIRGHSAETVTGLMQSQIQMTNKGIPQHASLPSVSTRVPVAMQPTLLSQTATTIPEKPVGSMLHISHPTNSSMLQSNMKNLPIAGRSFQEYSVATGPSMQFENTNNIRSAPSISYPLGAAERQVSFPSAQMMPTPTRSSFQQPHVNEPPHVYSSRLQTGNVGPASDSWMGRKGLAPNSFSQVNQNNYDASFGGPLQPQLQSGPPWERNEYGREQGFESWSPEDSPVRSSEYMAGGNYSGPGINPGGSYMPDNRPRQGNSSGYWDNTRHANRRWR